MTTTHTRSGAPFLFAGPGPAFGAGARVAVGAAAIAVGIGLGGPHLVKSGLTVSTVWGLLVLAGCLALSAT